MCVCSIHQRSWCVFVWRTVCKDQRMVRDRHTWQIEKIAAALHFPKRENKHNQTRVKSIKWKWRGWQCVCMRRRVNSATGCGRCSQRNSGCSDCSGYYGKCEKFHLFIRVSYFLFFMMTMDSSSRRPEHKIVKRPRPWPDKHYKPHVDITRMWYFSLSLFRSVSCLLSDM